MKFTTLLTLLVLITTQAQAQAPASSTPAPAKSTGSDKVDLKKLEDKYWSAKDDEYGVIQNRTFSKTGKFYLSGVYGPLVNDPFGKARASGAMLGYFINEDFGVELSYLNYNAKANESVENFTNQFGVFPDYNLLKDSQTLSLTYTPFYAKMAFMNKAILYFDMGFTLGVGRTNYEIQKVDKDGLGNKTQSNETKSGTHYEVGVLQQLFINQYLAFRLDIKNTFYTQKTKQYEIGIGAPESSRLESNKSANDTTITFGLTLFTK